MPELPEVEVVRRGLEPEVSGAVITGVVISDSRSLKRHLGHSQDFLSELQGQTILGAARRGKFLWFPLSRQRALVGHLGMSGQMLLGDPTSDFGKHLRVRLDLRTPTGREVSVGFVDQRIFGSLLLDDLVPTADGKPGGEGTNWPLIPRSVSHIARDVLDPYFDSSATSRKLRRKKTGIKRALLDQHLMSGVGNIYADEALWATRLHYDTPADSLGASRVKELFGAVSAVFERALREGGTSFDQQYVNVNGQSGYFSRSLEAYGRDGMPCSRCGTIIVRERFMNRSSYRCPRCQKVPRRR